MKTIHILAFETIETLIYIGDTIFRRATRRRKKAKWDGQEVGARVDMRMKQWT